ncbi:hypothetical protein [Herbiconiux sp. VKM Ac-2851]|uniref:MmyB family transcriptional regulator n=1 Tax=Herbiconiux sp. VKM Ac-2851 TaxID=2739025 RepID=UPI001565ED77|nr:hypothetical protein [Herbiconiux sp. VKM Ac-2851]NQX36437.1 hypothetical protein [Herbiconiux sp. VKM Ac-2851]
MSPLDPLLAELIESLPTTPAIVADERFDVVASNALARAVSPSLAVGVNLAEATFVNLSAHRTLPQWDEVSTRMVELLKEAADSEHLATLRAELARHSAEFAIAWREGTLPSSYALDVTMDHPDVGRLDITYELLRLPDTRQIVVMGHTVPGSESEQRLFELAARVEQQTG